jgi:hypothetical protein
LKRVLLLWDVLRVWLGSPDRLSGHVNTFDVERPDLQDDLGPLQLSLQGADGLDLSQVISEDPLLVHPGGLQLLHCLCVLGLVVRVQPVDLLVFSVKEVLCVLQVVLDVIYLRRWKRLLCLDFEHA